MKQNPFKNLGGDSQRVDCSWSQCFKNHYAQMYARHGFQLSHSLCQALLNNRQRQKRLTWAKTKGAGLAAEWSKVMFSDESKFSKLQFPLEIRVPESGEERRGTE